MIGVSIGIVLALLNSARAVDVTPFGIKVGFVPGTSQAVETPSTVTTIEEHHIANPAAENVHSIPYIGASAGGVPTGSAMAVHPAFTVYQNAPIITRVYQPIPHVPVYHPATVVASGPAHSTVQATPAVFRLTNGAVSHGTPATVVVTSHPAFAAYRSAPAIMRAYQYAPGFSRLYRPTSVIAPTVTRPSQAGPVFTTYPTVSSVTKHGNLQPAPELANFAASPALSRVYQTTPLFSAAPAVSTVTKYSNVQVSPAVTTVTTNPTFARYKSVPAFMRSYQYTPGFGQGYHTVSVIPPASAISKSTTYGSYNTAPGVRIFAAAPALSRVYTPVPVVATAPPVSRLTKYSRFQASPAVATVATNAAFARYQSVPAFMRSYQYTPGFGRGYHTVSVVPPSPVVSKLTTYSNYNRAPGVRVFPAVSPVSRAYQAPHVVAAAPVVPTVTRYPTLQAAPALASVATNAVFARYQSVPAFMRSYQYAPGFGRGYHTTSVVPPATDTSQLSVYNGAPAVRSVYPAAPALSRVTTYPTPAVSTLVTSPQFADYRSFSGSIRSDKSTYGFGRNYHTVSVVPPASVVSKLSTYVAPYKLSSKVTTYTAAPGLRRIYQDVPVVANVPGVPQLSKYSSFKSYPDVTTATSRPAFSRYQSVPAFMRSFQTNGFGRGYHTVAVIPPASAISKFTTYATYNPAPAVTNYAATPAVHRIYQGAPAVSRLTKYSSFNSGPAVATVASRPAFSRYQTVPAFMRSYQYTPGFGRGYHTVSVVPAVPAISKLSNYATYSPSPAVPTYAATSALRHNYQAPRIVSTSPAASRFTGLPSLQSGPAAAAGASKPEFFRYRSVPTFLRSYQYTPGFGRGYHTVSVVPPAPAVSKLSTYATYNPAPAVTTYTATPALRPIYKAAPVVTTAFPPSRFTGLLPSQPASPVVSVTSRHQFTRYQSVPAFMSSYQHTPGFGRGYHTVSVAPHAPAVSKLTAYAPYKIVTGVPTYNGGPNFSPSYQAADVASVGVVSSVTKHRAAQLASAVDTITPTAFANIVTPLNRPNQATSVVAAAPAVSSVAKYSTLQLGSAVNGLVTRPVFVRYQSFPAFMRSYQYTHGFGQDYPTVSVAPPASDVSKLTTYATYSAPQGVKTFTKVPVVKPVSQSAPVVTKYSTLQASPAGAAVSTSSAFARYESVPAFMRSYQYTPGFDQGYHAVSAVPPASAELQLPTYTTYNAPQGIRTSTEVPVVSPISQSAPVVSTAPAVTKYSTLQVLNPVAAISRSSAFTRYQSVPAFMRSYQYTPGFGQGYHTISAASAAPAFPTYNAVPAVKPYTAAPAVSQVYQGGPVVAAAPTVSRVTKYYNAEADPAVTTYTTDPFVNSGFQATSTVAGGPAISKVTQYNLQSSSAGGTRSVITDPAFVRYQAAPAVMRAFDYAPGFSRVYNLRPIVPIPSALTQLTNYASHNVASAATSYHAVPALSADFQLSPFAAKVPLVSRVNALQPAPSVDSVITDPAFIRYQSAPAVMRAYQYAPGFARVYHSRPSLASAPTVSQPTSHTIFNVAPVVTNRVNEPASIDGNIAALSGVSEFAAGPAAPALSAVATHPGYSSGQSLTHVYPSTSGTSHVSQPTSAVPVPAYNTPHAAPAVSSVPKYTTYHVTPVVSPVITHPAFFRYRAAPFITRVYQISPVFTEIYHFAPVPTVTPSTSDQGTHTVAVAPAVATVHVAPDVSISQTAPIAATVYEESSVGAVTPAEATVHEASGVSDAGPYYSNDHVTVNSAPAVTTAHAPAFVSQSATHGYNAGALVFGDGLPTYGHNYAYGLDGLNYRNLPRKKK